MICISFSECCSLPVISFVQQATSAFPELTPSESLKDLVKPLSDSIIKHGLLDHQDKDIRLLVGICLCEVLRVLAPNPGFSNAVSRVNMTLFHISCIYFCYIIMDFV